MKKSTLVRIIMFVLMLSFSGIAHASLNNGLVAYYPFGGSANDKSGNEIHGTVNGATLTNDRFDNTDNAYTFDGVGNYITIDSSSEPLGAKSISGWFKTSTANGSIWSTSDGGQGVGSTIQIDNDGKLVYQQNKGTADESIFLLVSSESYVDDTWHHFVAAWDGTIDENQATLYIDGHKVSEGTALTSEGTSQGREVIVGAWSNSTYFNGSIDDIRIYNRVLSETEIKQLYWGMGSGSLCPPLPTDSNLYNVGIEAGKQSCIDNPESCGIVVGGGDCTQADLDAARQEGYAEGLAQNAAAVLVDPSNLKFIIGSADYAGTCFKFSMDYDAAIHPSGLAWVMDLETFQNCTPINDNDQDNDGYEKDVDCDDTNPAIHPGAEEIPGNGIDEDCSPTVFD